MAVSPVTEVQRRVFRTVIGLIAGDTILFTLVVPALPIFADRYSLSNAEVAALFACFPLSQLVVTFAAARTIERGGRRPAMIAGAALLAAATAAFAVADHPALLAVARTAQGAAAALVWTAGIAAISDVFPQSELGYRLGLAETAGGVLGLLGPLAGGPMIGALGTGPTFALATLLPVGLLLVTLRVPETRRHAGFKITIRRALARMARRHEALVAAAALTCFAGVMALGESLLPLDLHHRLDASPTEIGLVFGLDLACFAIAAPLVGRWSDRHGRRPALFWGGLLTAATLPLLGHGSLPFVAAVFAIVGIGLTAMATPSAPLLVAAADESGLKGAYGISAAVVNVTFAAGYALGPLLGALGSLSLPFTTIVAVAALAPLGIAAAAYAVLGDSNAAGPPPGARPA